MKAGTTMAEQRDPEIDAIDVGDGPWQVGNNSPHHLGDPDQPSPDDYRTKLGDPDGGPIDVPLPSP